MDLSFSGAGFMGCYYFGVVNCWNKYIPRDRVRRVAGASAGSLIAAYYLLDLPLDTCLKEVIEMTEDVRSRPLGVFDRSNQIVDVLPKVLDKLFPADAHKRVNGRLFVSITRLKDMKNVIVNHFDSKQDLIDALNCSCFIPVWSGNHVATYKGVKHIDGGFTNNMPVFDEHTIRVCCFSGASDIAPYDRAQMVKIVGQGSLKGMPFNMNWKNMKRCSRALWPPPPSYIVGLLEQGFHDTKDFILSNDLIQCTRCFDSTQLSLQPIFSKRTPTISPAASPSVSRAHSSLNLSDLHRSSSFRAKLGGSRRKKDSAHEEAVDESGGHASNRPARVHIKQHRQQQPLVAALFEQDRSKSGIKIKRKCLERSQSELYRTPRAEESEQVARVSFARKLRERLQRVASSAGLGPEQPGDKKAAKVVEDPERDVAPLSPMPTIVIEEPEAEDELQIATIMEIMQAQEEADERERDQKQELEERADEKDDEQRQAESRQPETGLKTSQRQQRRTVSVSSGRSSSNDSAVGLDTPSPSGKPVSGSPAEKFFASSAAASRQRAASLATDGAPLSAAQQTQLRRAIESSAAQLANSLVPEGFHSAPSPLPSCPPSPNLNRHCTECIRLRQKARMDGIDEVVRREADLYGAMKSKDPEREFSSFKAKIAGWLRQFGTTKYSYSFDNENDAIQTGPDFATSEDQPSGRSKGRTKPRPLREHSAQARDLVP